MASRHAGCNALAGATVVAFPTRSRRESDARDAT
jgi:hypothetical protein